MEKKTFWDKLFRVVVGLCVVMLFVTIWGVGRQQSRCVLAGVDGPADLVREVGWDALVGRPPAEPCNSFGPLELKMPKTQIPGHNLSYSFTFKHAVWPGMDASNLYLFDNLQIGASFSNFRFVGVVDAAGHPGEFGIAVTPMGIEGAEPTWTFWTEVPLDASGIVWVEIPCSLAMTGTTATKLTSANNIIGKKADATHAKEKTLTEEWYIPAGTPVSIVAGGNSAEGVTSVDQTTALSIDIASASPGLDCDDWSDYMVGVKYVMSVEDIAFGAVDIDTSSYTATTWGETAASVGKLWAEGFGGNSIGFWCSEAFYNGAYVYNEYTGGTINAPYSYDFSCMGVKWMDGTPADSV